MAKAANTLATLALIGSDPMSGVSLQPAADKEAIRRMQAAARQDLGEPVPEGYLALLRITNGVQINGVYFKPAEHLVVDNLGVPRPEIVVLGTEGNMAEFVFDRWDRRFHTINMGFPDERFASWNPEAGSPCPMWSCAGKCRQPFAGTWNCGLAVSLVRWKKASIARS